MSLDGVMNHSGDAPSAVSGAVPGTVAGGVSNMSGGMSASVGTPVSGSGQGHGSGQGQSLGQQTPSSENMTNAQGQNTANTAANAPNSGFPAEAYGFAMPAAVAQDSALVSRIQDFCVGSKLSPQQAQAAMQFWQSEQNAAMEQGLKQCEQSLKERWQGNYEQRLEQARGTLKMLDARMEGRLMPLMQGPVGNSPVFAELLDKLSDVVGETTMEAGGMGGTRGSYAGSQLMSTEDFLRQVVFK